MPRILAVPRKNSHFAMLPPVFLQIGLYKFSLDYLLPIMPYSLPPVFRSQCHYTKYPVFSAIVFPYIFLRYLTFLKEIKNLRTVFFFLSGDSFYFLTKTMVMDFYNKKYFPTNRTARMIINKLIFFSFAFPVIRLSATYVITPIEIPSEML